MQEFEWLWDVKTYKSLRAGFSHIVCQVVETGRRSSELLNQEVFNFERIKKFRKKNEVLDLN